jgi:hypothetical protein
MKHNIKPETGFVGIRENEGGRWIDMSSYSLLREETRKKLNHDDKRLPPSYSGDNPVIDICRVKVEVIPWDYTV